MLPCPWRSPAVSFLRPSAAGCAGAPAHAPRRGKPCALHVPCSPAAPARRAATVQIAPKGQIALKRSKHSQPSKSLAPVRTGSPKIEIVAQSTKSLRIVQITPSHLNRSPTVRAFSQTSAPFPTCPSCFQPSKSRAAVRTASSSPNRFSAIQIAPQPCKSPPSVRSSTPNRFPNIRTDSPTSKSPPSEPVPKLPDRFRNVQIAPILKIAPNRVSTTGTKGYNFCRVGQ